MAKFWRRSWAQTAVLDEWDDSVLCATYGGFIIDLNGQMRGGLPHSIQVTGPHAIDRHNVFLFHKTQSKDELIALATAWSHTLLDVDLRATWLRALCDEVEDLQTNLRRYGKHSRSREIAALAPRLRTADVGVLDALFSLCAAPDGLRAEEVTTVDHRRLTRNTSRSWRHHIEWQCQNIVNTIIEIKRWHRRC